MEVRSDGLVQIFDLKMTHEDTDVIIPRQVVALADVGCKTINVTCDETDVFVLLAHYFSEEILSVPDAVSGCDTVGCLHSSRKTNVVKFLVGRD